MKEPEASNPLAQAMAIARKLHAVETLEYYDKNLLDGDNKSRSEWMQSQLAELVGYLSLIEAKQKVGYHELER